MPQVCSLSLGLGEECVVPPWPWYGGGGMNQLMVQEVPGHVGWRGKVWTGGKVQVDCGERPFDEKGAPI
jgi:hypothetical protein